MAKRTHVSVLEACVARLGARRGGVAAANVAQWIIATRELGHVASGHEYAEYWAIDERTAWRHAERCRAGLGDTWRSVVEELSRSAPATSSRRDVIALPVPA